MKQHYLTHFQTRLRWLTLMLPMLLLLISFGAIAQTYPAINGGPCNICVPSGWSIANDTPDLIPGNGLYVGNPSVTISGISGTSPAGGNMGLMLGSDFVIGGEAMSTTITGLTSGTQYTATVYWQQAQYGANYIGGSLNMTINGVTNNYTSSGVTDNWQLVAFTFTATGTTATLKLAASTNGNSGFPNNNSAIVVDNGSVCATPAAPAITKTDPTCSVTTGSINVTSPISGLTYTLSPGGATSTTGSFTGLTAGGGPYTVTATSGSCTSSASNSLTLSSQPTATVTPTLAIGTQPTCAVPNGTFTISNYNAAYTYVISPSAGVSRSGNTVTAPAGVYTVTATASGSCVSVASSPITLNAAAGAPATPTLSAPTQPTCSVSTGSFTISNYDPTYTYTVSPSAGVTRSGATITAPAGSYTVTATSGSCTSGPSSAVTLIASTPPTAPTLSTTTITNSCPCESGTVNLNTLVTSTAPAGSILEWHTSATPTAGNLVADPTKAPSGTYYAFYFNGSCYSAAGTPVTATASSCTAIPNLTPTTDIDGFSFAAGASLDFVVNLYEINNIPTTGTITFKISKLSIYTITYGTTSGSSNVFGGTANENSNWTFTEDANAITVTSKPGVTIPASGQAVIGFHIARTGGNVYTSQNLSVVINGGAGGETYAPDNSAITVLLAN